MSFETPEECREFLENLRPPLPVETKADLLMNIVGVLLLNMSPREEDKTMQKLYEVLGEFLQRESGLDLQGPTEE